MKTTLKAFVIVAGIIMVIPGEVNANPDGTTQKGGENRAKVQPRKGIPANMTNFWDSKQWDPEGAHSFWHATEDKSEAKPSPRPQPNSRKNSGLLKKLLEN